MEVSITLEEPEESCYDLWDKTWEKLQKWVTETVVTELLLHPEHKEALLQAVGHSSDLILSVLLQDKQKYDEHSPAYRKAIREVDVSFIYAFLPKDADYGDDGLAIPDHIVEKGFLFLEVFLDLLDDIFGEGKEENE